MRDYKHAHKAMVKYAKNYYPSIGLVICPRCGNKRKSKEHKKLCYYNTTTKQTEVTV